MSLYIKKPSRTCLLLLMSLGVSLLAGCQPSAQDRTQLKQELKEEILAELRQEQALPAQTPASSVLKDTSGQSNESGSAETVGDVPETVHSPAPDLNRADHSQPSLTGSAEGYVLQNGQGLKGCRVKLVRDLRSVGILALLGSNQRNQMEFSAVTNSQGKYVFNNLPVGAYKLKWQLSPGTGWIRRLKDKPDALITEGQTVVIRSVETSRGLVSP